MKLRSLSVLTVRVLGLMRSPVFKLERNNHVGR